MAVKPISCVGIVGAGIMGRGIAQVFIQSGWQVILSDPISKQLTSAIQQIKKGLIREVEKSRLNSRQKDIILKNIRAVTSLLPLADADLVIEAVNEKLDLKLEIFSQIGKICGKKTIFASNTSSISITQLGAAAGFPGRSVGMHFMNPVPLMPLVEVVRGLKTSKKTLSVICEVVKSLNKTPITINDSPGFVSNRVLIPMINEAIFCVYERVGSPEEVDSIVRLGMKHPLGPLALADLIGLDVCLDIMETLHSDFKDSKYRPCPLLQKMVLGGFLGRKSGQGFYVYNSSRDPKKR